MEGVECAEVVTRAYDRAGVKRIEYESHARIERIKRALALT